MESVEQLTRIASEAQGKLWQIEADKRRGRGKTWKSESEYGVHKAIKVDVTLAGTVSNGDGA